jgi:hypothetical protein
MRYHFQQAFSKSRTGTYRRARVPVHERLHEHKL